MLCGASFSYNSIFSWGHHIFKIALFHLSGGPWKIFCFFPCVFFLICSVLTATKDHGGKMVMSLAFVLLSLPISQGSRQWSSNPNHCHICSWGHVTCLIAYSSTVGFFQVSSFKWGLFTFLSEVLLECTVDIYQYGSIKKLQSVKSLRKF